MARRVSLIAVWLIAGLLAGGAYADTFNLVNGQTVTGEALIGSENDAGIQIKVGEGKYERVPWANFSQEDLKRLARIPKLTPLVEPFIEITQAEKIKKTEVNIKLPQRLELPPKQSLLGALFSSVLGVLVVLVLYSANLYAAYEISIFKVQSTALVCGVSAALPVVGPILFLFLPTKLPVVEETWSPPPAPAVEGEPAEALNPMQAAGAEHPSGLRLAGSGAAGETGVAQVEAGPHKAVLPETIVYQRGQFMFNRRFFETKFAAFFGVIRRDADKDLVLAIKSTRGEFIGQRITRIAANDLHLQVQRGHASEEVMIPFVEVQEIRLRHKDAK